MFFLIHSPYTAAFLRYKPIGGFASLGGKATFEWKNGRLRTARNLWTDPVSAWNGTACFTARYGSGGVGVQWEGLWSQEGRSWLKPNIQQLNLGAWFQALIFSPLSLRKWSNLTSIVFKWVETTHGMDECSTGNLEVAVFLGGTRVYWCLYGWTPTCRADDFFFRQERIGFPAVSIHSEKRPLFEPTFGTIVFLQGRIVSSFCWNT